MSPRPPLLLGLPLVTIGGAVGAVCRELLLEAVPVRAHAFPWTVFTINVLGSALLASLPALRVVRRVQWLPILLGTGVLGGFTTMSSAAVETMQLAPSLAVPYVFGTLAAALAAVVLVDQLSTTAQRELIASEDGDV